MTNIYRLACERCDRTDYDEVLQLPTDWEEIGEADDSGSASQWWTHVGLCPECLALCDSQGEGSSCP